MIGKNKRPDFAEYKASPWKKSMDHKLPTSAFVSWFLIHAVSFFFHGLLPFISSNQNKSCSIIVLYFEKCPIHLIENFFGRGECIRPWPYDIWYFFFPVSYQQRSRNLFVPHKEYLVDEWTHGMVQTPVVPVANGDSARRHSNRQCGARQAGHNRETQTSKHERRFFAIFKQPEKAQTAYGQFPSIPPPAQAGCHNLK